MTKKEIDKTAKELFETRAEDVLYSNPKGEFFTNKNFAELSLKKGEKLTVHKRPEKKETTPEAPAKKSKGKGKDTAANSQSQDGGEGEKGKGTAEKPAEETPAAQSNPKK